VTGLLGPTGESIEVWVRARDSARFQSEMKADAAAVESIGKAGKKATGGLAGMKAGATSLGSTLTGVGKKLTGLGGNIRSFGRNWNRHVTLPIVAVGAAATTMAIHFDRDMTQIQTQAGASAKEVAGFRKEVLGMAGHDVMQGPEDLAKGLFHLRSIGLKGKAALDALHISADGAAVGNANLEETATALGSAWLVNIKGGGNLRHVMGILNATVGAGNMRFGELVHALGTGLLPAAKEAGLSIKDTMGALAVFTDEGYQASSASAQFSTALHFLYNPTQKASTAMEGIGLKSNQLAIDMHKKDGLLTALKDLKTHLEGASGGAAKFKTKMDPLTGKKTLALKDGMPIPLNRSAVQQEQILGSILPGGRGRIMLTLLNQLDRYKMKLGQISKTSSNFGAAVKRTQETPAYKLHAAWATVQKTLIELGVALIPIVVPALQKMAHWVESVGHWFEKLSPTQKKIVLGFLGFLAVMGPLLSMIGFMTIGIGGLATALGFLAANPIVLIIIGIVALGVALFVAYKKVKWFHDAVNAVFTFLWHHWPLLLPLIFMLTGPIGVIIFTVVKLRKTFVSAFGSIKGAVGDAIRWMIDRFRAFIGFLGRVKDKIVGIPGVKQALGIGKFAIGHSPAGLAAKGANKLRKLAGLADGGTVTRSGLAVVGENGPELLSLGAGAMVSPFSAEARPLPSAGINPNFRGRGGTVQPIDPNIHVHLKGGTTILKLKGREIARAVAEDTDDRAARL
jgi:TP901 family phage tail tape measure protein